MYTVVWIEVGRSEFSFDFCRTQMYDGGLTNVCIKSITPLNMPIAYPTGGHHSGYTGAAIRLDAEGYAYVGTSLNLMWGSSNTQYSTK
jgi:hypothetical protein